MARTEARISVEIWEDPHFLSLSPLAQRLFMFLLSQRDLTHVGVLPLRERRWATKADGMDREDLEEQLAELEEERFIVVDDVEGEVLIRSFMRGDKVYRQPQVMRAAADQLAMVSSQRIRVALIDELHRISQLKSLHPGSAQAVSDMLAAIGEAARTLPAGSARPPLPRQEEGGVTTSSSSSSSPNPPSSFQESSEDPPTLPMTEPEPRTDVEDLCQRLAKWIIHNGSRTPTVSEKWRTEARLLIDKDKRPFDEIIRVMDWSQNDAFWKANILSMPKFREKYDQLRITSSNQQGRAGSTLAQRPKNQHVPHLDREDISAYKTSRL